MKRIVLLFVLGVVFVSGVFGSGEFETFDITINKAGSGDSLTQSIGVTLHENFGNAKALISLEKDDADTIKYCLFKSGSRYYDLATREILIDSSVSNLFTGFTNDPEGSFELPAETGSEWKLLITGGTGVYKEKTIATDTVAGSVKQYESNQLFLPLFYGNEDEDGELLILKSSGGTSLQALLYKFTWSLEFFKGERDFFKELKDTNDTDIKDLSYEMKCFLFMKSIYENETDRSLFITSAIETMDESDHDTAETVTIKFSDNQQKKSLIRSFMMAVQNCFVVKYDEVKNPENDELLHLPYIDCRTNEVFDGIYGPDRNEYLSLYLKYIYEIDKPLASKIIQDRLNNNVGDDKKYYYNQYMKINDGDELAKNALKYLTWGVE
jgi:hypothetical protein